MALAHTCHAHDCSKRVPPKLFMCRDHWFALRPIVRARIWSEYRPGQERDKRPSTRYMAVHLWAVGELAFKPHDEAAAAVAAPYLLKATLLREQCIAEGLGDPLEGIARLHT